MRKKEKDKRRLHPVLVRICLLGERMAGKSALVARFVEGAFAEGYQPTLKTTKRKEVFIGGVFYEVEITDTPAFGILTRLAAVERDCYLANDGFLLVYSVSDRVSFDIALEAKRRIFEVRRECPVLLVGTQADTLNPQPRMVTYQEGVDAVAGEPQLQFCETTATKPVSNNVFVDLIGLIVKSPDFERVTLDKSPADLRTNKKGHGRHIQSHVSTPMLPTTRIAVWSNDTRSTSDQWSDECGIPTEIRQWTSDSGNLGMAGGRNSLGPKQDDGQGEPGLPMWRSSDALNAPSPSPHRQQRRRAESTAALTGSSKDALSPIFVRQPQADGLAYISATARSSGGSPGMGDHQLGSDGTPLEFRFTRLASEELTPPELPPRSYLQHITKAPAAVADATKHTADPGSNGEGFGFLGGPPTWPVSPPPRPPRTTAITPADTSRATQDQQDGGGKTAQVEVPTSEQPECEQSSMYYDVLPTDPAKVSEEKARRLLGMTGNTQLADLDYFHPADPSMSRTERRAAIDRLLSGKASGSWLLRVSYNQYVVSLSFEQSVRHLMVIESNGQYFFSEDAMFPSATQLLAHYHSHPLSETLLPVKLTTRVPRPGR